MHQVLVVDVMLDVIAQYRYRVYLHRRVPVTFFSFRQLLEFPRVNYTHLCTVFS